MDKNSTRSGPAGDPPTELQRRVDAGEDRGAIFEELYRRLRAPLYAYVYRWVRDRDVAEDLVVEVFVKMWENFDSLIAHEPVHAWVFALAQNAVVDSIRRDRVRKRADIHADIEFDQCAAEDLSIKWPPGRQPPDSGDWGEPPRRYLRGQCPESVEPGRVFSLVVSVVTTGEGVLLKDFHVPEGGLRVLLVVHAPGLRALNGHRQTLIVPTTGNSEPVMFEMVADATGQRRISVTAWAGGSYLGELLVEVAARRDAVSRRDSTVSGEIRTEGTNGEVTLVVRRHEGHCRFEFRDVDYPAEVESTLVYDPGPAVERLLARLDRLAEDGRGYTADVARDFLVNAGLELWEQLIPETLRRQFWERQSRIRQLTILSDADTVPWELLYPKDPGYEAGFLVEQFPVTRALFGRWPRRTLRLQPAHFVLPEGSPPEAEAEIEALQMIIDPGHQAAAVVATLPPLLDLIRRGDFGLLHFACHNRFDPADGSTIRLDSPFLPMLLSAAGSDQTLACNSPLIFINACRSAGLVPSYNRLDGWAEKFLRAGAGAFIGSFWAVRDHAAREFAEELYRKLQEGDTLGLAVKSARQAAAAHPGDPTWLAYAVYGDPLARIPTLK